MIRKHPPLPHRRQRGVILVWTIVTFLVLLALVGLALDTARVLLVAHELQNAADAAALAGVADVRTNPSTARAQVIALAAANTAEGQSITVADNPANDPAGDVVLGTFDRTSQTFTATLTAPNAVKVVAHRSGTKSLPLIFGPIMGVSTSNVARTSIAMIGGGTGAGLIALDPSARQALYVHGNVTLTVNGGAIQVNSTNSAAALGNGASWRMVAPDLNVTGGTSGIPPSQFTGQINTGAATIPDPLSSLPAPSFTTPAYTYSGGSVTLNPGYYKDGLSMTGANTTVTLNPGTYIFDESKKNQGGLQINGGTFIANGCTLYIKNGALSFGANATITITPPQSGLYQYLSIWDASTTDASITGTNQTNLQGTVYAPNALMQVQGTSNAFSLNQLIADKVEVQGNGTLTINYQGKEPAVGTHVFLVQ